MHQILALLTLCLLLVAPPVGAQPGKGFPSGAQPWPGYAPGVVMPATPPPATVTLPVSGLRVLAIGAAAALLGLVGAFAVVLRRRSRQLAEALAVPRTTAAPTDTGVAVGSRMRELEAKMLAEVRGERQATEEARALVSDLFSHADAIKTWMERHHDAATLLAASVARALNVPVRAADPAEAATSTDPLPPAAL